MKIEKISDTQVKFILSEEDLAGKDIKLEDLAVSNDKTKELFQDILSKALDECGFAVDDAPLMVEALPVAIDSIMIIVTKLGSEENQSEKTDASAPIISKDLHRYKRNSIKIHTAESFDDSNSAVYSFDALDDVIDACVKISRFDIAASSLFKNSRKYYLVLQNDKPFEILSGCMYILNEYGSAEASNMLTKYHLMEHGETLIAENAVEILSKTFV